MMRLTENSYLIIIEGDGTSNYGAYAPDIPGCVATGETVEECEREMREAIEFHFESLRDHGEPIPQPTIAAVSAIAVPAPVA
jgi:predicted RNase H-like HicB family nuclease